MENHTAPANIQELLTLLGSIIAVFFVLSLAVETILDNFRGVLSLVGITYLKSQKTLQEGINEVADLVPGNLKEVAKFQALLTFVEKSKTNVESTTNRISAIRSDLEKIVDPAGKLAIVDREKEWMLSVLGPVKARMEASEDKRVFVLRLLSMAIGVGVSAIVGINVVDMIWEPPPGNEMAHIFGYVLGGLAAAGGSSFWHDQLDRVRNAKNLVAKLPQNA